MKWRDVARCGEIWRDNQPSAIGVSHSFAVLSTHEGRPPRHVSAGLVARSWRDDHGHSDEVARLGSRSHPLIGAEGPAGVEDQDRSAAQEVKAWLGGTEKDLLAKLKTGPVVIS